MSDKRWMQEALKEAEKAFRLGEVPVGAIITHSDDPDKLPGELVVRAHNLVETLGDPTAHAEIIAIRLAVDILQTKWLSGCRIYVTLEPCAMCAGAILQVRLSRLIYSVSDPKAGACGTLENLVQDARRNHQVDMTFGVLADRSRELLRSFFRHRRRGARVVDRGGLENRCAFAGTEGSNPSLSATKQ